MPDRRDDGPTPLPWAERPETQYGLVAPALVGADGSIIIDPFSNATTNNDRTQRANLALILRAVNNLADLIDALEQADERLEHDATCDRSRTGHCRCIKSQIARVLSRARGQ